MTEVAFTAIGWQNWVVPANCRSIDWVWATGPGYPGSAGAAAPPGFGGTGGNGGGGGAASKRNNIAVTPGETLQIYNGGPGEYSGLYRGGWLCLAYGGSGINGGNAASGVGDLLYSGSAASAGTVPEASNGAPGGAGGTSAGPWSAAGGYGGAGGGSYAAPGSPGGPGGAYGAGGGGGGGGSYSGGAGGAGGAAYQGLVYLSYTPYIARPPTVTALSGTIGSPGGGQSVVITGTNFDNSVSAVKFGPDNAASYIVNTATQITAVTPQHAAGTFDVRVVNVDGTSATSGADLFTFKASGGFNSPMLGF